MGTFLLLMFHYLTLVPILFAWKMMANLTGRRPLLFQLENQRAFAHQVRVFLRFFWRILLNQPGFYKV